MKSKSILLSFMLLSVVLISKTLVAQHDYEDALATSLLFFDANKCGPDATSDNIYSWRGACHTSDGDAANLDLTGGYHDAGDHVKFGLPQTWTAATLGFAFYEFREAFDKAGASNKMLSTLKYFTDYFLKCHVNATTFYYNVGDGNADHGYWGPPENQTGARPLTVATPSTPASDVCGEAAAALALMYLNYQDVNSTYANQCLNSAIQIFDLGKNNLGRGNDGGGGSFYKSSSHFDDLTWGAIWLYLATGDNSYLSNVESWIETPNDYGDNPYDKHWAPAWDDVTVFAMIKLYEITGDQKYYDGVINNLEWYRDDLQKTPYGLPWLDSWGVLRYASAEAAVGYLSAKHFQYADYLETADLTVNYCLGTNPRNSSYLTGWGNNPPVHPHHRANEPNRDGNTNGMIGALVGGPGNNDNYSDNVNDFIMNEVAIDYNASFVLGLAGYVYFKYNPRPQPNELPSVSLTSPNSGDTYNQGENITLSANASDSDGTISNVEFLVGGSVVGEDDSEPYSINWTVPLAGNYTVSARAIDDRAGATTSSEADITVVSNLPDPTTPNLALNKTASASSVEDGGLPASNAFDGNYSSRWSSVFSDPEWLQVDLGDEFTVNRVIIHWEAAAGSAYQIQTSLDGNNWFVAASIGGGNGGEDDIVFSDVSGRYVRMYGTERTTLYGYSIFEMEVYGSDETTIPVTGVLVDPQSISINQGSSTQLTSTVSPSNATNKNVSWSSGNTSIAIVSSSGMVTGVAEGSTTITVTTEDGIFTDTCHVSVTNTSAPTYDLTTSVTGQGSVSPSSGTFSENELVTLTATPASDWKFVSWSGDASGTSATITITMDSDKLLTANFEADGTSGGCDDPVTISAPFSKDGAGEFCWQTTSDISYVNSWNLKTLEINGVDFTNIWSSEMPPKQDGYYNIYYVAEYSWAHFEIASAKSAEILKGGKGKTSDFVIHCYPNPVGDKLNIQFSKEIKEIVDVYLVDVTGKVVLSDKAKGLSHTLDMSGVPVGLYTVKLSIENQCVTERIVKQ